MAVLPSTHGAISARTHTGSAASTPALSGEAVLLQLPIIGQSLAVLRELLQKPALHAKLLPESRQILLDHRRVLMTPHPGWGQPAPHFTAWESPRPRTTPVPHRWLAQAPSPQAASCSCQLHAASNSPSTSAQAASTSSNSAEHALASHACRSPPTATQSTDTSTAYTHVHS